MLKTSGGFHSFDQAGQGPAGTGSHRHGALLSAELVAKGIRTLADGHCHIPCTACSEVSKRLAVLTGGVGAAAEEGTPSSGAAAALLWDTLTLPQNSPEYLDPILNFRHPALPYPAALTPWRTPKPGSGIPSPDGTCTAHSLCCLAETQPGLGFGMARKSASWRGQSRE